MPLSTLTERQSTIAYAIDLLRAHQIRRENVFLHEQLKNCLKEAAALRDEVSALKTNVVVSIKDEIKDLKASIEANNSTTQKALALAENHELRLNGQSQQLEVVQQSCKAMESELSETKMADTKAQKDERARRTVLENQIQALQANCQNLDFEQRRQAQDIHVAFESFRTALDTKADTSAIETLDDQLEALRARPPVIKALLPSISRVSDSVQVLNSQQQEDPDQTDSSPQPPNRSGTRRRPRETVPEDLDLDANAHTISYAGHHQHIPEQNESMNMLPPSAAQATQLARVKTLRQRRFDDWTTYFDQGHKLMENLPSSFEGTVLHNFVDGIFKAAHKKQCRQWLDSNGWTWANITAFGDSFSQIVANSARDAVIEISDHVDPPRLVKDLLAATGPAKEGRHGKDKKESPKPKPSRDTVNEPLRRSQRLIEKDSQNKGLQEIPFQKAEVAVVAKIAPARAHVNKKDVTVVNDVADGLTNITKQAQSKVAEKRHVQNPQRKEAENRTSDSRRVASGHLATAETQVSAARRTRKRNPEPAEDEQLPKRSKSNKGNTSNYEIAKPKLVSAKQQITRSILESSDDKSFWLTGKRPGQSAFVDSGTPSRRRRPAKYSASGAQRNRDQKKPQLPLPPPPEIPITDTTEEE